MKPIRDNKFDSTFDAGGVSKASILEHIADVVWIKDQQGRYVAVSKSFSERFQMAPKDIIGKTDYEFRPVEFADEYWRNDQQVLHQEETFTFIVKGFRANGEAGYFEVIKSPVYDQDGQLTGTIGSSRDVTERQRIQEQHRLSEDKFSKIFHLSPDAVCIAEYHSGAFIEVNDVFLRMSGYTREEVIGKKSLDLDSWVNIGDRSRFFVALDTYDEVLNFEVRLRSKTKGIVHGLLSARIAYMNGEKWIITYIRDITERKTMEEKLIYLSQHDEMTRLYNRRYLEAIPEQLLSQGIDTIGLLLCDIDGLKFINDTIGHSIGDDIIVATADLLRTVTNAQTILARIGGDEFAVVMLHATAKLMEQMNAQLEAKLTLRNAKSDQFPIHISTGYAIGNLTEIGFRDLFKMADDRMFKNKLLHSHSHRGMLSKTLMQVLKARDFDTKEHGDRLKDLICTLAQNLDFSHDRLNDLRLLAQFHDIGKIGIADAILLKPGPLSNEEREEMRRHSLIGLSIAQTIPELSQLSDWILKHHEWWNGEGYPLGLKEDAIPIECRMLSIVDAYDAMTSDRPYRKALSSEKAVAELQKFAGIQFDPSLVELFVEVV